MSNNDLYKQKYLKYKLKYLEMRGGKEIKGNVIIGYEFDLAQQKDPADKLQAYCDRKVFCIDGYRGQCEYKNKTTGKIITENGCIKAEQDQYHKTTK